MPDVNLSQVHEMVMVRMKWAPFFKSLGLDFVAKDADAAGWVVAAHPDHGEAWRVNIKDGDVWMDATQPKGDAYDLLRVLCRGSKSDTELLGQMAEFAGVGAEYNVAVQAEKPATVIVEPIPLQTLADIDLQSLSDKRVKVPIQITSVSNVVYDSPLEFMVDCTRSQSGKCHKCPVDSPVKVDPSETMHVAACHLNQTLRAKQLRGQLACSGCFSPRIKIIKKGVYRELWVGPNVARRADVADADGKPVTILDGVVQTPMERRVYMYCGNDGKMPKELQPYMATGWVRTSPRNAMRTLLIETLEPLGFDFEHWKIGGDWGRIQKLKALGIAGILADFAKHHTKLYERDEILLLQLLAYCSPRRIDFNAEQNLRGWLTVAILGSSAVGKSRTYETLNSRIGAGDAFSCKTGTRTGLLWATVQNHDGDWRCRPGAFPRSSRRILCIEECQSLDPNDLNKITQAMEDGWMKPENVAVGVFETETRLILNSNCRRDRGLDSYPYGCLALRDLFTDIFLRRVDVAMVVKAHAHNPNYNRLDEGTGTPAVEAADLRALVYFAWTVPASAIHFSRDATLRALKAADTLSAAFGGMDDHLPLVCGADVRHSIARLATAYAVLSCSITEDGQLNVGPEHAEAAEGLLTRLYAHPDCGLDLYAAQYRQQNRLDDYQVIRHAVVEKLHGNKPFAVLLNGLQRGTPMAVGDLCALLRVTEAWVRTTATFLVALGLCTTTAKEVLPTAKATKFVRRLLAEDVAAAETVRKAEAENARRA